jgi:hypothetical protein
MPESPNLQFDPLLLADITDRIFKSADKAIETTFDPSYWVLTELQTSLFENQIEIFNAVIDPNVRYLAIIGARAGGKTFGVAAGIVRLCLDNPGLQIGVYAPKAGQATRVLEEVHDRLLSEITREKYLDKNTTTKSCLRFKNGSVVLAQSAQETTHGEGFHSDVIICDENQRISDIVYRQRLIPSLKGSLAKIIGLGVPMYKGHFWESFQSELFTKLKHDWLHSPKLFETGVLRVDGIDYPRFVVDQMPKEMKKELFPEHPELWYESITKMSVEDFKTQYQMEWLENLSHFLTEEDQIKLASGIHLPMEHESSGEIYYAGIDFAGGEKVGEKIGSDFSTLVVWRKNIDGSKDKVFGRDWKGDLSDQLDEIVSLIHPLFGTFKCRGVLADYGNQGAPLVDIMRKKFRIPIDGVFFQSREPSTGKNYKNAMYEYFQFELRNGRVRYPDVMNVTSMNESILTKTLRFHFEQWCGLERHRGIQVNDRLNSADGERDDSCAADSMAIWSADKSGESKLGLSGYKIPVGKRAVSLSMVNRLAQFSRDITGFPNRHKPPFETQ